MIQIHLLEAKIGRLGLPSDSAKQVYMHFESELFRALAVDSSIFFKSYDYYSQEPEIFTKIYGAVVDSLMEMESREKLIKDEEEKALKSDTLKTNGVIDSLSISKGKQEGPELDKNWKLEKFKSLDSARINKEQKQ